MKKIVRIVNVSLRPHPLLIWMFLTYHPIGPHSWYEHLPRYKLPSTSTCFFNQKFLVVGTFKQTKKECVKHPVPMLSINDKGTDPGSLTFQEPNNLYCQSVHTTSTIQVYSNYSKHVCECSPDSRSDIRTLTHFSHCLDVDQPSPHLTDYIVPRPAVYHCDYTPFRPLNTPETPITRVIITSSLHNPSIHVFTTYRNTNTNMTSSTCSQCTDHYKRLDMLKCGRCQYEDSVTESLKAANPPPPIQTRFCKNCSKGGIELSGNLCADCQSSDSEVSDSNKRHQKHRTSKKKSSKHKSHRKSKKKHSHASKPKDKKSKKNYNPALKGMLPTFCPLLLILAQSLFTNTIKCDSD